MLLWLASSLCQPSSVKKMADRVSEISLQDSEDSLQNSLVAERPPYRASPFQKKLKVGSKPYYIIHDVEGTTEGGEEGQRYSLECQLEYALERKYPTIIVENSVLGYEVVRWIRLGNFLHKTAVLSGAASLAAVVALRHPANLYLGCSAGAASLVCAGVYTLSWQLDPCCKYQVDYSLSSLAKVPRKELKSNRGKHVVLTCKDDKYRKRLHNAVAFAVVGVIGWQLYRHFTTS